ncbi:MAG: Colicin V production accessory protein CvpA, regulator of purF expression and biofilm formation [Candidatus Midichloria mitochondrii]|uniref:CvpA family protein n=1 Tax=Midichloria mitochondrii (strain IricVA) TaxID=696127 RepID=F7XUE6_MIDMI|nr:CvpA family protein [Candidatus Midichloria mitochondrii]AEI89505.1 cvpA family protein [Candidatus Midichloria mitochondrii IricVA]MDJ1256964.1 CvpA family protein [Candidatus Midichloria mitochondrii]MDJ1288707.1 CvpA family protein [Candidatus Midichloria mitochondrii]MDJ1299534.1 CvpA family protein [Candidatus Midichloria mitochondrii]MDJ1313633.1 CvpA family protein [Candidatus Midichloria mitochondrii]
MDLLKSINYNALNYIDMGVIAITTLSIIFGIFRGFIISVISLMGWVASIVVTYRYAPLFKKILAAYFHSETLQLILSYSGLLIVCLMAFAILNSLFSAMTLGMRGGFFDRLLGLLFGLFRGALISSFIFMCINFSFAFLASSDEIEKDVLPEVVKKAQTYKLLKIGNAVLLDFMPSALDKRLKSIADTFVDNAIDDKFVGGMVRKMYQDMSELEIDEIERKIQQRGIDHDEKQVAKTVLDYYRQKVGEQKLDPKSLEKLERIIDIEVMPEYEY